MHTKLDNSQSIVDLCTIMTPNEHEQCKLSCKNDRLISRREKQQPLGITNAKGLSKSKKEITKTIIHKAIVAWQPWYRMEHSTIYALKYSQPRTRTEKERARERERSSICNNFLFVHVLMLSKLNAFEQYNLQYVHFLKVFHDSWHFRPLLPSLCLIVVFQFS